MAISDEKYVCTTTYRASGQRISTATWIVALEGGAVGFWTSSRTGKVKRLRKNPSVTIQPSDSRGRPRQGTVQLPGKAALVTSGPQFDELIAKVKAKYGFMTKMAHLFNTIGHRGKWPYADVAVVITLDD